MLCVSTSRVSRRMILFQEISGQDAAPDSSPVIFTLRDARGTGARGVMGSEKASTSRSRAARVAQHEDDWGRVRCGSQPIQAAFTERKRL